MRKIISYAINSAWRTNDKLFMFPHAKGAGAHSRSRASVASRGEIASTLGKMSSARWIEYPPRSLTGVEVLPDQKPRNPQATLCPISDHSERDHR
jgi:hypothetical protein